MVNRTIVIQINILT